MTREEINQHLLQYDNDCKVLSFTKYDHPSAVALHDQGEAILSDLIDVLREYRSLSEKEQSFADGVPVWLLISLIGSAMKSEPCPTDEQIGGFVGMVLGDNIDWLLKQWDERRAG